MSKGTKADRWMPFYTDDYTRDTLHLTRDQHGGYMLLLIACWNAGGRIKNDPAMLAAIAKATPAEWRKLAPVLKPFFRVEGRWLSHKRIIAELEKAQRMLEARQRNGARGGRPKTEHLTEKEPRGFSQPPLAPNLAKTPARVEVEVSTSEVANTHSPIQEFSRDSTALSEPSAGAVIVPLAGRGGQ